MRNHRVLQHVVCTVVVISLAGCTKTNTKPGKFNAGLQDNSGDTFAKILNRELATTVNEGVGPHPNPSIELALQWQGVYEARVAEKRGDLPQPPRAQRLQEFVEGCERATGKRPPEWWINGLTFGFPETGEWQDCKVRIQWPSRNRTTTIIRSKGKQYEFAQELGLVGEDVAFAEDDRYVFAGGFSFVAQPFELHKIKKSCTTRPIWTATVWANNQEILNYTGAIPTQVVVIELTETQVIVYGISMGAAYLEVFSRETGKPELRFSSVFAKTVRRR
ncbi:MAG: hypothetical protein ACR2NP_01795 [Pirellulaceae bacterium]